MRIEPSRPSSVSQARRPERRTGLSGFSGLVNVEDEFATAPSAPTLAAASIASLLDLQMVNAPADELRRQKAKAEVGHLALDLLTDLQRALAVGGASVTLLQSLLTKVSAQVTDNKDPQLDEIMNEIHLRLAVETAKLEMASTR